MTFEWPQITYLVLVLLGTGITLAEHGKPKTGNHNIWTSLLSTAIVFWILLEGGFFK